VVSVLPHKYIVEKVGGARVSVIALVHPGDSPHTYEPKPSQMAALAHAALFFTTGVEFEQAWLPRLRSSLKTVRIVALDSGITKIPMACHHGEEEHAHAHDHNHAAALDPHIWLAPELVKGQAAIICSALVQVDAAHAALYRENYRVFMGEISALQDTLRQLLARAANKKFLVFHPSWGYFAQEFGLVQVPVEIGGREPRPAELEKIMVLIKKEGISAVFVQPHVSSGAARVLAAQAGLRVCVADDLPEAWDANLRAVAAQIGAQ
jgi:zinc transport system substrate-binding protein